MTGDTTSRNPLLEPSDLDHELPDFRAIALSDLVPTFRTGVVDHRAEIAAIVANPQEPTWENTMEPLEASGQLLDRLLAIVFNYAGTDATDEVVAVEETVAPELAEHVSAVNMDAGLFARVNALSARSQLPEGSEDEALLTHWLRRFRRGGAALDDAGRTELATIDARLAELSTRFGRNLVAATDAGAVLFTDEDDLAGLSPAHRRRLAADAAETGQDGWLVRLGLPSVQPVIEELDDPAARTRVTEASRARGRGTNDEVVLEIVRLRARRAELLGYPNHAEFVAEEETAGSLAAVDDLLGTLTPAAVANAAGEYKLALDKSGAGDPLTESDWPYWAAKLRAEELDVDEAEMKKYFPLERVLRDGAFFAAQRLYGITVAPREDLVGYHPDVRVWEVREEEAAGGQAIGLILTDMYARPTKRGGAWMSSFVDQNNLLGQTPVVVNVLNIAKPAEGEAGGEALLSIDEVMTVFHEFGHALHGLLSDVRYPSLSGTNVPRDFVEFPSQINENWALEPAVLANYARHVETGEPLPQEMVDAVRRQAAWGQGFSTSEYLAACWLDLAWHRLTPAQAAAVTDVASFEQDALEAAGFGAVGGGADAPALAPRYSSTYFNHIFAGGYSADYWSYLWAEVLDADGFEGFVDTDAAGRDGVDPDDVRFAGDRFRRMVLSRGATIDYDDAFWMFRGKQRSVEPLLRRRGLAGAADSAG
ncbi:M3 family metallopeptidase [Corynebacterium sp. AOP34-AQ2-28]|uniref:M3 family metallopeptidase n=1 Tax=Corynebacterium sp. AOP34-AQ2-28 TaxID=3457689 RepID=UPI004033FD49